ncbi:MAG: hypothetical protein LUD27_02990 [Clostridia bacterium]|nr:hypothetical protein [Clostridia bacterium]
MKFNLSLENGSPKEIIRRILSSKYFPFFTAAFFILCYYPGWDMAMIYYAAVVGIAMVLLLDDLTPLISMLLFMCVMITAQHSPSQTLDSSDYFTRPEIYWQAIILIALYIIAMGYRVFYKRRTSFRPTPIFWGLCLLALAFLLNGAGSSSYTVSDLMYGVFMAFFFLFIFVLFSGNVKLCEENYIKISYAFLAFSVLLVVELAVKYISVCDMFMQYLGGEVSYNHFKEQISFGWGIWNTMGMLLCLCIPAMFMLASKSKHGYLFVIYGAVLALCAVLSMSRQAMLGAVAAFAISSVGVLIKSRTRLQNAIVIGVVVVAVIIFAAVKREAVCSAVLGMMESLFSDEGVLTGNGRVSLVNYAVTYFAANPAFGSGFFMALHDVDLTNLSFVPEFACNTFAEMLGACGMFGLIAYCIHRIQTIMAFAQKPDWNKFYIAAIVVVLLLLSLIDNHIFNIFPTMIYSGLLAFAVGEEKLAYPAFRLKHKKVKKEEDKGEE